MEGGTSIHRIALLYQPYHIGKGLWESPVQSVEKWAQSVIPSVILYKKRISIFCKLLILGSFVCILYIFLQ